MTMIGGGTGVAPMLQMIVAVLANPADKTQIKFLFAKKHKDILLKYTLDRLQRENPDRFSVHCRDQRRRTLVGINWTSQQKDDSRILFPCTRLAGSLKNCCTSLWTPVS